MCKRCDLSVKSFSLTPSTEISPHVVILAAGRGSRLGALGDATPKWLLDVGGRTLADLQLEGLRRARGLASVTVATGHAAGAIERRLARAADLRVGALHVAEYEDLNNWWTLLRALRALPDDGPVIAINADLCARPEAVAAFVDAARGPDDALLAVDLERPLTDESMKVALHADGTLAAIGKAGVDAPVGEYVGMLMARGPALAALREALEAFVGDRRHASQWYEGAVGACADAGVPWRVWPMPGGGWVEIDDDADLCAAETLMGAR
jgi:choline kinase